MFLTEDIKEKKELEPCSLPVPPKNLSLLEEMKAARLPDL